MKGHALYGMTIHILSERNPLWTLTQVCVCVSLCVCVGGGGDGGGSALKMVLFNTISSRKQCPYLTWHLAGSIDKGGVAAARLRSVQAVFAVVAAVAGGGGGGQSQLTAVLTTCAGQALGVQGETGLVAERSHRTRLPVHTCAGRAVVALGTFCDQVST